jgi:hypothetical protein
VKDVSLRRSIERRRRATKRVERKTELPPPEEGTSTPNPRSLETIKTRKAAMIVSTSQESTTKLAGKKNIDTLRIHILKTTSSTTFLLMREIQNSPKAKKNTQSWEIAEIPLENLLKPKNVVKSLVSTLKRVAESLKKAPKMDKILDQVTKHTGLKMGTTMAQPTKYWTI